MPFVRKNKSVYLRAYQDEFFTTTQRQAILKDIINQSYFKGGCEVSIKKVLKDGVAKKWFPFHDRATVRYLRTFAFVFRVTFSFWPQGARGRRGTCANGIERSQSNRCKVILAKS